MRLLFLAFNFHPDLAPCSFRATPLVAELSRQLGPDVDIDVFTTSPNRYGSYSVDAPAVESSGNVTVHRIQVPRHANGMAGQSLVFAKYAAATWSAVSKKPYDGVFATSSRLATGCLGALLAKRKKAPYFLEFRDIFPDTMHEVLGQRSPLRILLPIFRRLERYAVHSADNINLVSEGFKEYFEAIDKTKQYSFITNGVDNAFIQHEFSSPTQQLERAGTLRRLLYAGNIGAGQGLEHIVPHLANLTASEFELVIIGDGGTRQQLSDAVDAAGATNVRILPPVSRDKLLTLYASADVLFLHLNDYAAFRKVLPSKVFEYAATGKPILAGVSGYAEKFIIDNIENAAVFPPGDAPEARRKLGTLRLESHDRQEFVDKFSRRAVTAELARRIGTMLR